MKNLLEILIYIRKKMHLKESKSIILILRIIYISLIVLLFLSFTKMFFNAISYRNLSCLDEFKDFYLFEPSFETNQKFASKYSSGQLGEYTYGRAYSEYLGEIQNQYSFIIRNYNPIVYYEDDKIIVLTYSNNESFKSNFSIPSKFIKKGRSYKGTEKEVVLVKGSLFSVGDTVILCDSSGIIHTLDVVGETKYSCYLQNIPSVAMGLWSIIAEPSRNSKKTVFLMNPQCDLNNSEHFFNSSTAILINSNNQILLNELREKGNTFTFSSEMEKIKTTMVISFGLFFLIYSLYILFVFLLFLVKENKNFYLELILGVLFGIVISTIFLDISNRIIAYIVCLLLVLLPNAIFKIIDLRKKRNILLKENDLYDTSNYA